MQSASLQQARSCCHSSRGGSVTTCQPVPSPAGRKNRVCEQRLLAAVPEDSAATADTVETPDTAPLPASGYIRAAAAPKNGRSTSLGSSSEQAGTPQPSFEPQPQQQQQPQQHPQPLQLQQGPTKQPRIVLTPLPGLAVWSGSNVLRNSSPLGTWSAVGPPSGSSSSSSSSNGRPKQQQHRRQQHKQQPQQQKPQQQVDEQTQLKRDLNRQRQLAAALEAKQRRMTAYLSSASDAPALLFMLQRVQPAPPFNIVHIAAGYKKAAAFSVKAATHSKRHQQQHWPQQQEQQQEQQEQQEVAPGEEKQDAAAAAVSPEEALQQALQLLDQELSAKLNAAEASPPAAAAAGSAAAAHGSPLGCSSLRPLSGVVSCCANMGHKLSWDVVQQMLNIFLEEASAVSSAAAAAAEAAVVATAAEAVGGSGAGVDSAGAGVQDSTSENSSILSNSIPNSSSTPSSSSSTTTSSVDKSVVDACLALSMLCWGLSKLGFTCSEVYELSSSDQEQEQQRRLQQQQQYWRRLAAVATPILAAGSPRDVSLLCWAFAAAGYTDVALWGRLGYQAAGHMHSFTPQEFAQTMWGFAAANVAYKPVLTAASEVALQLTPGLTPQGISNILWAFTKLSGAVPAQVLRATQEACLESKLESWGSANLTIVINAHARTSGMRAELAVAMSRAVLQTLPTFSAENLCKVLAGLGVLNCLPHALLDAAVPRLMRHLRNNTVDVQVACHGVWGVAMSDTDKAIELMPSMLQQAGRNMRVLARSSDSVSKLCSAMAVMRYRDDAFFDRLAALLLTGQAAAAAGTTTAAAAGSDVSAADHSNMFVSSGNSSSDSGSSIVAGTGHHSASRFTSPVPGWDRPAARQHIVSIAVALAKLGLTQHTALLELLIQQFLLRAPLNTTNTTANNTSHTTSSSSHILLGGGRAAASQQQQAVALLWCAAVLDMRQPVALLVDLLQQLQGVVVDLPTASLAQLVQVHLWLKTLGPTGRSLGAHMPRKLLQEALVVWRQQIVPNTLRSELHTQVLKQLRAMQLQPQAEGVTRDGMFSVDIMVKFQGCGVALEVLGPTHYTANLVVVPSPQQGRLQQTPSSSSASSAQEHGEEQAEVMAAAQQQQQHQLPQHMLLGPELLRFRLLAACGLALAAVSSFEASGAVATPAGTQALRELLLYKLTEAVQLHKQQQLLSKQQQQPANANASSSSGSSLDSADEDLQPASPGAAAGRRRGAGGGRTGAGADLSRLVAQQGFSEVQVRMRTTRKQHLQGRAQRRKDAQIRRIRETEQAALQTLFTAAAAAAANQRDRGTAAGAEGGVEGGGAADGTAAAATQGGGGEGVRVGEAASVLSSDAEFDLNLDLDHLDLT